MREYADFLATKLKESSRKPLDTLAAFVVAWSCVDSTKPLSLSLRRMLGLGYIGSMEEAFSKALALISSDPGFKEKAIEALYIAVDRDWVRKDLLEVAWKNAGKELLQAINELSNFRRSYSINIFKNEIESAISAQQEKTFEALQEQMIERKAMEISPTPQAPEVEKPPLPSKEKPEEVEAELVRDELTENIKALSRELSGIKIFLDKLNETLDSLRSDLSELLKNTSSLVFLAKMSDTLEYGLSELKKSIEGIRQELSSLTKTLIKEIKEIATPLPPPMPVEGKKHEKAPEAPQVGTIVEEKIETPPPPSPPPISIETPESEEGVLEVEKALRALDKALEAPEAPEEKVENYLFAAIGNLNKLENILRDHAIAGKERRWRISIRIDSIRYVGDIQGLYPGISEDILKELMEKSISIIIVLPVKNMASLAKVLEKVQTILVSLKVIIIDSENPIKELEKVTSYPIIYRKIDSADDVRKAIVEALRKIS